MVSPTPPLLPQNRAQSSAKSLVPRPPTRPYTLTSCHSTTTKPNTHTHHFARGRMGLGECRLFSLVESKLSSKPSIHPSIDRSSLATFNTSQPNSTKIYQQTGKHQFATIHYVVTPFFAKFPVELALFAHQFSTQFLSSPLPSWKQASLHGRSIQERGLDFCPV